MWKSDSLRNRSLRYCGARSFRDLYIIVDVSFTIISLTDNQPSSLRNVLCAISCAPFQQLHIAIMPSDESNFPEFQICEWGEGGGDFDLEFGITSE